MHDSSIKNTLILRASSIGDCLMGKYFLENVHAAAPEARCTLLVASRSGMIKDLLAGYEWLDVVEVNRKHPLALMRAFRALRPQDITLTQYAERPFSLPSKIFARLVTRRGGLVGFTDSFWGNMLLYDSLVPFMGERLSEGMIVEEQKALTAVKVPVAVPNLRLSFIEDSAVLQRFGVIAKQYVIAHLFAGSEGRNISQEKRRALVRALRESLPAGYQIILSGVVSEAARAEDARSGLEGVINLAGKTSVQELINLIAQARTTLALDSGAAHIAAHLQVPLAVMVRTEARSGWWSHHMYRGRPILITNKEADDQ